MRACPPSLLDLFFPPQCVRCGAPTDFALSDSSRPFCLPCAVDWSADCSVRGCSRCGATVEEIGGGHDDCPACRNVNLPVQAVARVGAYGPAMSALIGRLKFHGDAAVMRFLGAQLAECARRTLWCEQIEAIVPVAATWLRRLQRPLHAPTELATRVGSAIGRPVLPLLGRVGHPPPQTGLSATARAENVRGTFRLRRGVTLKGATLLLVDDVITSRATSFECARVLRKHGAERVYVAVLAKTEPPKALRPGNIPKT